MTATLEEERKNPDDPVRLLSAGERSQGRGIKKPFLEKRRASCFIFNDRRSAYL